MNVICSILNCRKDELNDKTLILDGFDEIVSTEDKQSMLKVFLVDIKDIKSFHLLITSRENYIDFNIIKLKEVIYLKAFSDEKIRKFYYIINGIKLSKTVKIENKEVLGIPVILYMALIVKIDITDKSIRSELYEKIFAIEGGIYDRFEISGNIIACESSVFCNMLHYWKYKKDDLLNIKDKNKLIYYIRKVCMDFVLNLSYMNLREADLRGADLVNSGIGTE